MKCPLCKCDYPTRLNLIDRMMIDGAYVSCCPICALAIRNAVHGLDPKTPFTGEIAKQKFDDASDHLRATNQTHDAEQALSRACRAVVGKERER